MIAQSSNPTTIDVATWQADHRLGLRVLGTFVLIFLAIWGAALVFGVGPNLVLRWLGVAESTRILLGSTLSRSGVLIATVLFSSAGLRSVTGIPARERMFPRYQGWVADLLVGVALAAGAMGLILLVERAAGWLSVEGVGWQNQPLGTWVQSVWLALLVNLLAAVGEEALFRGFLLTGLSQAWGKRTGLVAMAGLFALSHINVAGASETHWTLFTLLLALPGLMLGWVYLRTGALWMPIGIHLAWNLFQDDVLALTGQRSGTTLFGLITQQQGPAWFVGTSYGIEVGAAGILALLVVVVGVLTWTRATGQQLRRLGALVGRTGHQDASSHRCAGDMAQRPRC